MQHICSDDEDDDANDQLSVWSNWIERYAAPVFFI